MQDFRCCLCLKNSQKQVQNLVQDIFVIVFKTPDKKCMK